MSTPNASGLRAALACCVLLAFFAAPAWSQSIDLYGFFLCRPGAECFLISRPFQISERECKTIVRGFRSGPNGHFECGRVRVPVWEAVR